MHVQFSIDRYSGQRLRCSVRWQRERFRCGEDPTSQVRARCGVECVPNHAVV